MPRNAETWIRFAVSRNALENNPIYDLKKEDFERIKSKSSKNHIQQKNTTQRNTMQLLYQQKHIKNSYN